MATWNKFDQYIEDLHKGVHDWSTDSIKVALCAAANAPVASNSVLTDLTTASLTFLSDDTITVSSVTQTTGTLTVVIADKTLLASGGSVGPFRYVVLYNDTPTSPVDPLLGWVDYGSDITLLDTEDLLVDFAASTFTAT